MACASRTTPGRTSSCTPRGRRPPRLRGAVVAAGVCASREGRCRGDDDDVMVQVQKELATLLRRAAPRVHGEAFDRQQAGEELSGHKQSQLHVQRIEAVVSSMARARPCRTRRWPDRRARGAGTARAPTRTRCRASRGHAQGRAALVERGEGGGALRLHSVQAPQEREDEVTTRGGRERERDQAGGHGPRRRRAGSAAPDDR